ncbi:MAG: hypothetical protein QOJ19_3020 [Acidimicrobiia bacterium]|jgi:hypothetical protein|nr:hypothetical protein [Acidimicrobiia bacterium]
MSIRKLLGIGAIVAVAGVGAAAFTATSTIDQAAVHQGSVHQQVAGLTVSNVSYTFVPATDTVTQITANAVEDLVTDNSVLTVALNGTAPLPCTGALVTAEPAHTVITCDIGSGVANVTDVRFTASR